MVLGKRRRYGGCGNRKSNRTGSYDMPMPDAYRRRYRWRKKYLRGKTGFAKAVKNVILKTAESKYAVRDLKHGFGWNGFNTVALSTDVFGQMIVQHNFLFEVFLFENTSPSIATMFHIAQGDRDDQRNGDEIYATGMRLRIQCENDAGRHNMTWKFWLVEWNTTQGEPVDPNTTFHSGSGCLILDTIQNNRIKMMPLGTFRTKARDVPADKKTDIYINKWIPFKRKLSFAQDSAIHVTRGMKEKLALVGVAYDTSNTTIGSAVGNIRVNGTFYYKDP